MSREANDSRGQAFQQISSRSASPVGVTHHEEVWRVLVERLTADHIFALGFFLLCLTLSFRIEAAPPALTGSWFGGSPLRSV